MQSARPSTSVSMKQLSTVPSQLLSSPSQSSVIGVPAVQESDPAEQVPTAAHSPTPQAVAKLSTVPSQSLSRLSQISVAGEPAEQESTPAEQVPTAAHSPTPQAVAKVCLQADVVPQPRLVLDPKAGRQSLPPIRTRIATIKVERAQVDVEPGVTPERRLLLQGSLGLLPQEPVLYRFLPERMVDGPVQLLGVSRVW